MIITCAFSHCGQEFDRNTTFQKYCCSAHRLKDWALKHRPPKSTRVVREEVEK